MGLTTKKKLTNELKWNGSFRKKQAKLMEQSVKDKESLEEFYRKEAIGLKIAEGIIDLVSQEEGYSLEIRIPNI